MNTGTIQEPEQTQALNSSLPQGLNLDDNATYLNSAFLNHWNQLFALQRQRLAQHFDLPCIPPGNGISVVHNHQYPPPEQPPQEPPSDPEKPGLLSKLAGPAALLMGGALGGAGLLSYFNHPAPIIAPVSKETTTNTTTTTAPPLLQPPSKNPGYRIGVE